MKLITWNCNMAFRKKAGAVLAHRPDILVVQECEHPDKQKFDPALPPPTNRLWFGSNRNKGLGIFSYRHLKLRLLPHYNPEFKMVVPIAVTGWTFKFTLYAVWANNPDDPDGQYVEQVWKAIQYYDKQLHRKPSILAGDFNSNTIWDRKYRVGNHSHVVKRLEEKGIFSCYHRHYRQVQGKEAHPTFYLYKHRDKPYHLDYCFASAGLIDNIESVDVGDYACWKSCSDHVPVMVNFAG